MYRPVRYDLDIIGMQSFDETKTLEMFPEGDELPHTVVLRAVAHVLEGSREAWVDVVASYVHLQGSDITSLQL